MFTKICKTQITFLFRSDFIFPIENLFARSRSWTVVLRLHVFLWISLIITRYRVV